MGSGSVVHDFKEELRFSEEAGHEEFWQAVYQRAFPNMLFATLCTGKSQGQELGVDRIIQLSSGKTLRIDEKKRRVEYGDILLEYVSVDTTGAPGWIEKDLIIDYLSYAFMPSKRCYVLPWEMLRRAWQCYKQDWLAQAKTGTDGFRLVEAQNNGYKTLSVAVPTNILLSQIKNAMVIQI